MDGEGRLTQVKTSALEDRQSAMDALCSLFHRLKGPASAGLAPYAPAALAQALGPLRAANHHSTIFSELRSSCLIMLEDLFDMLLPGEQNQID